MIQHWEENEKFPPEKYYEACITYHIVRYCEEKQMGRIFPFSISQIQEKKEGYDFGYQMDSQSLFFVQYKRPQMRMTANHSSVWMIDIGQLKTIVEGGIGACTYYALPEFYDYLEWYEGLEKTYFLNAEDLYTQIRLQKKMDQKTVFVRNDGWKLRRFEDYFSVRNIYRNVLIQAQDAYDEAIDWKILEEDFQGYFLQRF